jgi:hypothetical protein
LKVGHPKVELIKSNFLNLGNRLAQAIRQGNQIVEEVIVL